MSHISQFDMEECAAATKGLSGLVQSHKKARGTALWDSYLVQQTPRAGASARARLLSRRISFQPDLQIGVEDEDHAEEIQRQCLNSSYFH